MPSLKIAPAVLAVYLWVGAASAQAPPLKPELSGLAFLVGGWAASDGTVAETGGHASGTSRITVEAQGAVLLRRDHTVLTDANGAPAGDFDQIMMIYADAGAVRADYSDGTHLIHYDLAQIEPGRSVTFASRGPADAPTFRLTYALTAPNVVAIDFGMVPPGAGEVRPIASGVMHRTFRVD